MGVGLYQPTKSMKNMRLLSHVAEPVSERGWAPRSRERLLEKSPLKVGGKAGALPCAFRGRITHVGAISRLLRSR